jgi:calcineurin-like phosphoesterase family protein
MKITQDTWLISDSHFGHDNIIKYQDRPENFNEIMVSRWNRVVKPGDTVLHLGDLAKCPLAKAKSKIKPLNGNKFLILGNHDLFTETSYKALGFTVIPELLHTYKHTDGNEYKILFTHKPVMELPKDWFNIHGHVHNVRNKEEYSFLINNRRYINVCVEALDYTPFRLERLIRDYFKEPERVF